ncbi:MAG TPA: ATP-binding protein, partial [Bryobacteraceae bacterium]|nr:ATP-binding protein [Bryobacteraceae bacterium]
MNRRVLVPPAHNHPLHQYPLVLKCALTVVLPVGAILVCALLETWLTPSFEAPFVAAVAVVAWLCGTPYAIAATVFSLFALEYFFVSPEAVSASNLRVVVKMSLFLAANGVIIGLIQRLFRSQAEWAHAEQRHRGLSELIPFGGWLSDPHGNILSVSDSFLNTFKASPDQIYGLGWLNLIGPEQREQIRAEWLECMRNGYFWDYEYRMRSPDGSEYVVLSRGVPVRDRSGRVRSWVGMHLDITELRRSAEQRIEQSRDLARFNAELEQLAYVSSHDLQEPLRNIASYLQLLSKRYKGKLDSDADTFIEFAVEGANHLKVLLQDLMLLQQVGKSTRQKVSLDLGEIIRRATQKLRSLMEEKSAEIHYENLPCVLGDEPDLTRLFENLLENCLKYSRAGVVPKIAVTAVREGQMWRICVQDNGIGIQADYLERIFEIFQRLHPRSAYPGTGIGLAICKKIVETHGGRIWAESELDKGSTFLLTLPAGPL